MTSRLYVPHKKFTANGRLGAQLLFFPHPIVRAANKVCLSVDGKIAGIKFVERDHFLCHAGLAILLTMEWE